MPTTHSWPALLMVVSCGGGGFERLECLPGGADVIETVFVRTDKKPLLVPFSGTALVYEPDLKVWRPLMNAPTTPGTSWVQEASGDFFALTPTALSHTADGESWETVGPGLAAHIEYGKLLGKTTDGRFWARDYFGTLQSFTPGASEWQAAFASDVKLIKAAAMGPDHSIWVVSLGQDALIRGLWRVKPDGSAIEEIYGCDARELLLCQLNVSMLTFNAKGDLFFADTVRFFQRDVSSGKVVERVALKEPYVYANTMAAVGDSLYLVARDQMSGGESYLLAFDPGSNAESKPRLIGAKLRDRNSEIAGGGSSRMFVHSPGVCELVR